MLHRALTTFTVLVFSAVPVAAAPGGGNPSSGAGPASAAASAPSSGSSAGTSGSAASGTSGYQNTSAFLRLKHKTLFILVYGPDAATTNYIAYETSLLLGSKVYKNRKNHAAGYWTMTVPAPPDDVPQWVLPEPSWTLGDYATQCQNDHEHTAGALVLYDIENDAGSFSWLLFQNTYAHLYAKAALVSCKAARFDASHPGRFHVPQHIDSLSISKVTTSQGEPSQTVSTTATTGKQGGVENAVNTNATTTTIPAERVVTATETQTALPKMEIVWQNSEMLSGHRLQRSVPFLAFAGFATYLASRYTVPTTTNVQTTLPSPNAAGGTVQTSTQRTYNAQTDLPLSLAVLGSTVGGLSTSNIGGANQSRILKNAAAALATRLVNIFADECAIQDGKQSSTCTDIESLSVFDVKSLAEYSERNRAEASKP